MCRSTSGELLLHNAAHNQAVWALDATADRITTGAPFPLPLAGVIALCRLTCLCIWSLSDRFDFLLPSTPC